jgi:hypothetical protein
LPLFLESFFYKKIKFAGGQVFFDLLVPFNPIAFDNPVVELTIFVNRK